MSRLRAAISRLERAASQRGDAGRSQDWPLMHMLSVCLLAHSPQWEGLTAADCDAETWREIEETRAWAERRYEDAERLAGQKAWSQTFKDLSVDQQITALLSGSFRR